MERLIGQFDTASRELIDGVASDCHDDSSLRKHLNVYVVLASEFDCGIYLCSRELCGLNK